MSTSQGYGYVHPEEDSDYEMPPLPPPRDRNSHLSEFSSGGGSGRNSASSGVHTPILNPSDTALLNPPISSPFQRSPLQDSQRPSSPLGTPDDKDMYDPYRPSPTYHDKSRYLPGLAQRRRKARRRCLCLTTVALVALAVAAAVVVPIYFKVIKKHHTTDSQTSGAASPSGTNPAGTNPGSPTGAITGGNGSTILTADGGSFVYINNFGGTWYYDPANPFVNNAQAQSFSPPLNTSWKWGNDQIRGVNLGGWLVLEPFITPALFQKYPGTQDEWTLSVAMRNDTGPGGGIGQIEDHYKTFITEEDFAQIAGAGLNWIRLPIPFWAVETFPEEPFLGKTCWTYILQAFQWARKYGLRINLDLHTAPGSQNGYNHSGRGGQVNFLNGVMGIANAQRMMGYIRIITEFISQPEWKDVVPFFGIINEARVSVVGQEQINNFYLEAHDVIRGITGYGEGNGPIISIHDGFVGISAWKGFLEGSDRIALDTHPYFSFDGQANNEPLDQLPLKACAGWGPGFNASQYNFGITVAGEFSASNNDCGLFLLGTTNPKTSYESHGGNCDDWTVWENFTDDQKAGVKGFALGSMDALSGEWFFWTWKIGNDSTANPPSPRAPLWSYSLGLEHGWMPEDPRSASGICSSAGLTSTTPFSGTYSAWQTGGAGAGTIDKNSVSQFGHWPPTTINNLTPGNANVANLPTYTSTGAVPTLPPPTLTFVAKGATQTVSGGNGWADASDTQGAATPVAGCQYPDAWSASGVAVPSAACTGAAAKRGIVTDPAITARAMLPVI